MKRGALLLNINGPVVFDVRFRLRQRHAGADVNARLRRLVIGNVLRCNAHPVNGIMHQCIEAVGSGLGSRVNAQRVIFAGPVNHFFTPVAEDVGGEGRR